MAWLTAGSVLPPGVWQRAELYGIWTAFGIGRLLYILRAHCGTGYSHGHYRTDFNSLVMFISFDAAG
jgi:hypothetical protein